MKKTNNTIKPFALLLALVFLISSCSSTTLIQSSPPAAKVYLNAEFVGETPLKMKDTKIVGSKTNIEIKKEGFEDFETIISRNEEVDGGAIVGGVFFLVPFLWVMKYKPVHEYQLVPINLDN